MEYMEEGEKESVIVMCGYVEVGVEMCACVKEGMKMMCGGVCV